MRLAIIRQRYVPAYTRNSQRWTNADEVLDNFMIRSKNFGLLYETQGDVWVVEDGDRKPAAYNKLLTTKPDEIYTLYAVQEAVAWNAVPWSQYQVIITADPIAPAWLIDKHKTALWCYFASEHSSQSWRKSTDGPMFGYDVFLDHTREVGTGVTPELPAVLFFPAIISRRAFAEVIDINSKMDAVFLDSHAIRKVDDLATFRADLGEKLGMPVLHPRPWDYAHSYRCVAERTMMSTREYLQTLASCRFFWYARTQNPIGQAIPEAAGLGCIVLAGRGAKYADVCHPATLMDDAGDVEAARKIVRAVKDDAGLCAEILAYQNQVIDNEYKSAPIDALEILWKVKRQKAKGVGS